LGNAVKISFFGEIDVLQGVMVKFAQILLVHVSLLFRALARRFAIDALESVIVESLLSVAISSLRSVVKQTVGNRPVRARRPK
jgi:hypothetical protein